MTFAIMRTQKLKSAVAVRGSLKHTFREQETPNADLALKENNVILQGANNSAEVMRDFRAKLPEKIRKNGVQCVELLITGSHEIMHSKSRAEQIEYFQDSLDWIGEKFGGKENIINAGIHYDERTPHMYVYLVPLDEKGKLNCRKFMGGTRHVMSELQDSFANEVGKKHGLSRGLKGSKAKHQSIGTYYKKLNESMRTVVFTEDDLKKQRTKGDGILGKIGLKTYEETEKGVVDRLNHKVEKLTLRAIERDEAIEKYENTLKYAKKLQGLKSLVYDDLEPQQFEAVKKMAAGFKQDNQEAKEQARRAEERAREERWEREKKERAERLEQRKAKRRR